MASGTSTGRQSRPHAGSDGVRDETARVRLVMQRFLHRAIETLGHGRDCRHCEPARLIALQHSFGIVNVAVE
jgi:hypothetical protein